MTAQSASRGWTLIGLAVALCGMPLAVGPFAALLGPRTAGTVMIREMAIFVMAGALAYVITRGERLGADSVGLGRADPGSTALWTLLTIVAAVATIAISLGLISLLGLRFGSSDPSTAVTLPSWVVFVMIVRAGLVEELFYRGYAIDRLRAISASRALSIGLPLAIFAVFHYKQGTGGILIALLTGGLMTAIYLYKRNLWVNVATHFLVDFVPNLVLPLFSDK